MIVVDKAAGIVGVEGMRRNSSVWFTKLLKRSGVVPWGIHAVEETLDWVRLHGRYSEM